MAEVKKKLQTRKGHRLFVRNTIAKVKELLPEFDLGAISPEIKFRLQAHLSTLERQQKEIEILDNAIADLVEDELIEKGSILQNSGPRGNPLAGATFATSCYQSLLVTTSCYQLLPVTTSATSCYQLRPEATSCYQKLPVATSCYQSLPVATSSCQLLQLLPVATSRCQLLPVTTSCYQLLPVATSCYQSLPGGYKLLPFLQ